MKEIMRACKYYNVQDQKMLESMTINISLTSFFFDVKLVTLVANNIKSNLTPTVDRFLDILED